ncbi:hypothetical protein [Leptospira sarikeiensis]|uniref:Uncharacterized protein n=1 Tax=Leptospira sarikeiensis TaxID=2484943 RepID=A0A4V3JRP9_9LEPT|nr:hypothetical protein [Leptospira sarikeiensis]TGL61165.1 hypothetical protein EHQ64_11140 [Leptospira sarikeiensis]
MSNNEKNLRKVDSPEVHKKITINATIKGTKRISQFELKERSQIKKALDKKDLLAKPTFDLPLQLDESRADHEGEWTWGTHRNWEKPGDSLEIIKAFRQNYVNKLWKEIFAEKYNYKKGTRQKHIYYPINKLCKEARQRLTELENDDFEEIFRFRLMGKFRFFGFTCGDMFIAIWHDPLHKIYPIVD